MNPPCLTPSTRALFDDDQRQREARRVCHECPLQAACRAETLRLEATGNPVYGVAGGLLPGERPHAPAMDNRKRQGRYVVAPCGTTAAYRRHQRNNEPPCAECKEARNQAERKAPAALAAAVSGDETVSALTIYERAVAVDLLTAKGYGTGAIAARLGITPRSVTRIRGRLGDLQASIHPQLGDSVVDGSWDDEGYENSSRIEGVA